MFAASRAPAINAAAYILLDANSGAPIASFNADTRRAVASTQKILTALVVLDAGNLDKPVRVSSSDLNVEPTRLGIKAGEVYTRRKLLYAFLVKSANDVANVLARPESDPEVIRRLLVEQVTGRVRWRESMEWMASEGRVTRFVEVGSGKVLTGMAKRIAPDAESLPLNTPEELEAFARGVTSGE
jgi:malonyl CoA-acyl carrier protein transacylase